MPDYFITLNDYLYRRVPKNNPNYWKEVNGIKVPSSFAFKTKPEEDGLSVNIVALTTSEATIGNVINFGVAEISASIPIDLGFECKHDPQPENDAHALIVGNTNPIAKKLSNAVTQVILF
jgi:hypothetical protein